MRIGLAEVVGVILVVFMKELGVGLVWGVDISSFRKARVSLGISPLLAAVLLDMAKMFLSCMGKWKFDIQYTI